MGQEIGRESSLLPLGKDHPAGSLVVLAARSELVTLLNTRGRREEKPLWQRLLNLGAELIVPSLLPHSLADSNQRIIFKQDTQVGSVLVEADSGIPNSPITQIKVRTPRLPVMIFEGTDAYTPPSFPSSLLHDPRPLSAEEVRSCQTALAAQITFPVKP